jgi:hypothetical protein
LFVSIYKRDVIGQIIVTTRSPVSIRGCGQKARAIWTSIGKRDMAIGVQMRTQHTLTGQHLKKSTPPSKTKPQIDAKIKNQPAQPSTAKTKTSATQGIVRYVQSSSGVLGIISTGEIHSWSREKGNDSW